MGYVAVYGRRPATPSMTSPKARRLVAAVVRDDRLFPGLPRNLVSVTPRRPGAAGQTCPAGGGEAGRISRPKAARICYGQ
jgi:hypothetical protein